VHRRKAVMVAVVVSYGLITVFMTYPVIFQLTPALAGSPKGDAVGKMWMLWWNKKALLDLQINPANLTHLYHPSEPYHPLLIVYPFLQLHALPLLLMLGPIAAYNVEFLFSFVLTGLTTYMLCYYLTNNHMASFIGGVIFAFFPNKMLHSMGHLPLITLYLFPLYVLFLFLLLEKPDLRRGLSLGLILALSLLIHIIHIAYFLIPFTLVFFLWHLYTDRPKILAPDFLRAFALACLIAGVLTMPLFGPFLIDELSGKLVYLRAGGSEAYSADLLNFFAPSSDHPVVGELLKRLPFPIPGYRDDETLVYLGLTTLALAVVGCMGNWGRKGMWMLLALVAGILSCGPFLKWGGQVVHLGIGGDRWPISLPYALVDRLPFYEWGRTPARLVETVMFSLAILASFGTALLLTRLRTRRARVALTSALTALMLFEYMIVYPFPMGQIPLPGFYHELAADSEDYAVLDIPFSGFVPNHTNMYYQVVHGHRIVGGFIHRVPAGVRPWMKFFEFVTTPPAEDSDIIEPLTGPERAALLDHYDVAFVVLQKRLLASEELQDLVELVESLPSERVGEDGQIVAFPVPSGSGGTVGPVPVLAMGKYWSSAEYSDNVPFRWMGNDATIEAWVHEKGEYQLRFEAQPFEGPRHLQIFADGELVEEYHVEGVESHVTSPFMLQSGEWTSVRFHVPDGCERPSEVLEGSQDSRCLSMLFRQVTIEACG
jgi:hypothetical protein